VKPEEGFNSVGTDEGYERSSRVEAVPTKASDISVFGEGIPRLDVATPAI
jgi:hypothetical protein